MVKLNRCALRRNLESLSLFAWAADCDRARTRYPRSARLLARRFGLSLATAATIAELAGIGQLSER